MLEIAPKDHLTGFYLRDSLLPFLKDLIFTSAPQKKTFSLALIDLDHFKNFNDKFGHIFGDEILKYATGTLRLTFSEVQFHPFRYGGDEFIVIFPDKGPDAALRLLQQCNYNLRHRPFLFKNKLYKVTASCGIAGFPSDGNSAEEIIHRADEAMYFSKRNGRNRATLANKITYLKARNAVYFTLSILAIILSGLIAYQLSFKKIIQPAFTQLQTISIQSGSIQGIGTKPKRLDMIVFKNGIVTEGYVISETTDKVIVELYLEKGQGRVTFNKNEIAQIKYGK